MKIFITGGAGFIGTNLVRELSLEDHEISVLDNLLPQIHGVNATFPVFEKNVKTIFGDIRDKKLINEILKEKFDIVFHLAALTGVGQSMYDIREYVDVTSMGTANLLEGIVKSNNIPKKIILSSSRAVYGEGLSKCEYCDDIFYNGARKTDRLILGKWEHQCPKCGNDGVPIPSEEDFQAKPTSIYGVSKYHQEELCKSVSVAYGIPLTILRYFNVFGPGQSPINPYTGVLSIFCRRLLNRQNIEIYEDGREARDFVYIKDVVKANILAAKSDVRGTFNICSGEQKSILEIAQDLAKIIEVPQKNIFISGNYRTGDIRHGIGSYKKAEIEFGYFPSTKIKMGLEDLVNWMLTQNININGDVDLVAKKELKERGLFL